MIKRLSMKNLKFLSNVKLRLGLIIFLAFVFVFCSIQIVSVILEKNGDCSLKGHGTKDSPYLISSKEDLIEFSNLVNGGMLFNNKYVEQTCDIDMAGIDFMPIGIYGSENVFKGYYNGRGYTISNISITTLEGGGNNGLFGFLAGVVMNLNLEGGQISGGCCGSFASHASSFDAMIINCKSTCKIEGIRAGGIADNFNGYVIGCWYYGEKELPIVSYNAVKIAYSYSNFGQYLPRTFVGECVESGYFETEYFKSDEFSALVNSNLPKVANASGINQSTLIDFNNKTPTSLINSPINTLKAYKFHVLGYVAILASIVVIVISLHKENKGGNSEE